MLPSVLMVLWEVDYCCGNTLPMQQLFLGIQEQKMNKILLTYTLLFNINNKGYYYLL